MIRFKALTPMIGGFITQSHAYFDSMKRKFEPLEKQLDPNGKMKLDLKEAEQHLITDQSQKQAQKHDFEFEEDKFEFDVDLQKPTKKPTHKRDLSEEDEELQRVLELSKKETRLGQNYIPDDVIKAKQSIEDEDLKMALQMQAEEDAYLA